jgi:NADPH:quinone reductase-like Zn-dependent oxidoreductase
MPAIQQEAFGGAEVLRLTEAGCPEPMGAEVLVRVRAAQAAAYAEYVTAPSRQLARKPSGVLITDAVGGVGHLAVQIARARDAYVIGTASAAKHDFVRTLGADEVIDYTKADPAGAVSELDVTFDPVGGTDARRCVPAIKPGGMPLPFHANDAELAGLAAERGMRAAVVLVEPDGHALEALAALAEAGQLRVEIDTALPLAEAAKAHEIGERGRTRGKTVLTIWLDIRVTLPSRDT